MKKPQHHRLTDKSNAFDQRAMAFFALLVYLWLFPACRNYASDAARLFSCAARVTYSPDGAAAVVSFTVSNQGGNATEPSQIVISEYQTGREHTIEPLPPLAADQAQNFAIQLSLANLTVDGIISFKIEAGIDEFELANSPIARDNSQLFHIDRSESAASSGDDGSEAESAIPPDARFGLHIPIVNLGINFLEDGIQAERQPLFRRRHICAFSVCWRSRYSASGC